MMQMAHNINKSCMANVGRSALLIAALCAAPMFAQTTPASQPAAASTPAAAASTPANDSNTYATGKPLSTQSNEGFWGHLNPMARKKWVKRQIDPVKDRLNELDQLSAKNAADIKDFDARAQAGIHQAQTTADAANAQAATASTTATQAQQAAFRADAQTTQLTSTVANLDQYKPLTETELRFRAGQTVLNAKAKDALDQIATQLQGQKGYIVEVQGYSSTRGHAGIANSEQISQAVVRYLVVDHNIPVYRIHLIALGNVPAQSASATDTAPVRGSLVHVTLMENSLATLSAPAAAGTSPIGATQTK